MRYLFLALIMTALICGCTKEKDPDGGTNSKAACTVRFTPATVDVVSTRADPTVSYLPQGEPVGLSAYAVSSSDVEATEYTQFKKFSVSDAVGTITPDDGVDMKVPWNRYKFYAYSPVVDFRSGSKKTLSIPQGTDFKVSSVDATASSASLNVPLPALSRKCSYVQFMAQAVPGTYVHTLSIGANGFTFNKMTHSPIDYTLGEANINLTGAALDANGSIAQSAFTTITPDIQYVGGTAVLPKTDGPFTLTLDVSLNSVRQTMTAAIPTLPFLPGYIYRFSLVFCDPGLSLVLQVLPWADVVQLNDLGINANIITTAQWISVLNALNLGTNANIITTAQWVSILNALNLGTNANNITTAQWISILNALNLGANANIITTAQWISILNSLNLGANANIITTAQWVSILNSLNLGTNANNITVASWTNAINAILNQGGGTATIVVGSWGATNTWNDTQGVHQGGITLSDWTVNPNWNANIGVALAGMGIAAWNNGSSSTTMGE